uniref:Si:dkeyp-28d2.4 n=1 Tax=Cyprinus carpio TaxID=7962 RepID=A0A8C1H0Y5_CYPCA
MIAVLSNEPGWEFLKASGIFCRCLELIITALTGSCVQIPCTFNISNFEDKRKTAKSIYGIWLKNKSQFADEDSFIAFNSSKNIIRGFSDVQMTGNLSESNCTTVFYNIMMNHSDSYYFRLEMEPNVFRATFNPSTDVSRKTVRINVRDSPQPPELKPNDLKVMEETTVNLICSAEAPCPKQPPTISWSNIPESAHITTQLQEKPDKNQSVFSYMTFKASYKDHRRNISCTATYPRNTPVASTVETIVMLRVLFPPKGTCVIITPSVGTNVTLTCKSRASPSNDLNYTWYKHGEEKPIAWGMKINLTKTQNQIGSYHCIAQNKYGKQSSEEAHNLKISPTQAEDKNRDTTAIYTNNATAISKNDEKKETDELHYGEIDFSKLQTGHKTREHSNNGPETEYSELQVTERKKQINSAQKMDELYAQVQKK